MTNIDIDIILDQWVNDGWSLIIEGNTYGYMVTIAHADREDITVENENFTRAVMDVDGILADQDDADSWREEFEGRR